MGLHVVIPVAGAGTRLRPHTHTRPKALVPVAGKPMLGHILDDLAKYDIDEIMLIVSPEGEASLKSYVEKHHPKFKFAFVTQTEPKGLGHAIWMTADAYRGLKDQLLIALGDTIFDANFDSVVGAKENWIAVREVEDPRRYGVVMLEEGRIKAMVEKPEVPPSNLAIVGIYAIENASLLYKCLDELAEKKILTRGEMQLTDALQLMIERGAPFRPFEIQAWHDCGKPETLLETNRSLLARFAREKRLPPIPKHDGCIVRPPVAIAPDAQLSNSIVGPNVSIGAGTIIRDSIIEDSIVAESSEIGSVLLRGSIIADHARVVAGAHKINVGDHSELEIS